MGKSKINIKRLGWTLSLTMALFYILDFVGSFLLAEDVQEIYLEILGFIFLGFNGYDIASFIAGLIQVFVTGWIIAGVFGFIWNKLSNVK